MRHLFDHMYIGIAESRLIARGRGRSRSAFGNRTSAQGKAANAAAASVASSGGSRSAQLSAGRAAAAVVNKGGRQTERSTAYAEARQEGDMRSEDQMFDAQDNYVPPPPKLKDLKVFGDKYTDQFLGLLNMMPEGDAKKQAFSYYSQFQKLDEGAQKSYLDSLFTQAQTAVSPIYEQDAQRVAQDYTYEKTKIDLYKKHLQDDFNLLKEVVDFNKVRAVAKENNVMAETIQRITSSDFIQSVTAQGLTRRQNRKAMEVTEDNVFGIKTQADQQMRNASQTLGQQMELQDLSLANLGTLKARSDADREQQKAFDERSLFLSLFGNDASQTTQQSLNAIPTGSTLLNMNTDQKRAAVGTALDASSKALQSKLKKQAKTMTPTVAARFKTRVTKNYGFNI